MNGVGSIKKINLGDVQTLVFAGGGNRCWWQAGALAHWMESGWFLPTQLVGTSAGAGVAAACMINGSKSALDACEALYSNNARIFDWSALARFKLKFAHQHIYPAWIGSFVNASSFEALRQAPAQLRVAITRPARALGLTGSVIAGTLAYIVDRYIAHSIHPGLPKFFGLRQDFVSLNSCDSLDDARNLLIAAAAAPPIMPAQHIANALAMDGGYTDNAPIPAQSSLEKSRTLVLLTRHYPKLPSLFRWCERSYWQPSRAIPVSTWECLPHTTVREAFALGMRDAIAALGSGQFRFA